MEARRSEGGGGVKRAGFIVLLVALGAMTNAAIAWGWALVDRDGCSVTVWTDSCIEGRDLNEIGPRRWQKTSRFDQRTLPGPPHWARPYERILASDEWKQGCGSIFAFGWPLPVVTCARVAYTPMNSYQHPIDTAHVRLLWGGWRSIPTRVYWSGFVANTALYAFLWRAILLGAGACRSAIRRHGGLCPRCAYDLRADLASGCPECGWKRPRAAAGASA